MPAFKEPVSVVHFYVRPTLQDRLPHLEDISQYLNDRSGFFAKNGDAPADLPGLSSPPLLKRPLRLLRSER
jgi:hypothetical protein